VAEARPGSRRAAFLFVYVGAFVQGLVMVSFAATSPVLVDRLGFSEARYGSIFLPHMVLAVLGALGGALAARRVGLPWLLSSSFLGLALSQVALAGAGLWGAGAAYPIVLLGTGLMGFGSGLGAAPMNTYPQLLSPERAETAVVAVHTTMGFGLAAGPLLAAAAIVHGAWPAFPLLLILGCLPCAWIAQRVALPSGGTPEGVKAVPGTAIGLFAALAFLYALVESIFSNWAVLYLHDEKRLPLAAASLALSFFWAALSGGRMIAGAWLHRLGPERVYAALPVLMTIVLALMPGADTPARALPLFALAGLSCSAFYPLTVALASRRFPGQVPLIASLAFAALVLGIGIGTSVTGALHERFPLATLYRVAVVIPILAIGLGRIAVARRAAA
jgi:predicted MFS family arabinose efflux permease